MKKQLISVITPAYNRIEYIEETIYSVLNQTYPHIEYIVVDDGSNDGTFELLQQFHEQGKIKPWCKADTWTKAWGMSEIRIMAYRLSEAAEPESDEEKKAREQAIDNMPDKGKFSILWPLYATDDNTWRGKGVDGKGELVEVVYDSVQGLLFEKQE